MPFHANFDAPIYDDVRRCTSGQFRPKSVCHTRRTGSGHWPTSASTSCCRAARFDLTQEYGGIVAASVVCELVGLPVDLAADVLATVNAGSLAEPGSGVEVANARPGYLDYLMPIVARRRAERADGALPIVDNLIAYRLPDGSALTDIEAAIQMLGVFIGGTETVPKIVAHGLWELSRQPDQLAAVRADLGRQRARRARGDDPLLRARAVVRPNRAASRSPSTTPRSSPGQRIITLLASASRDEREYPDPDEFIWNRPHRAVCWPSAAASTSASAYHLARLEIAIMVHRVAQAGARLPHRRARPRRARRPASSGAGTTSVSTCDTGPMSVENRVTYCRICEPLCGLIATVEDGRLVSLRPDPDHPLSQGRACPKGIAFTDIQNDPDRVLTPLRRRPDGEFEEVSWDDALDDIAARLIGDRRPTTAAARSASTSATRRRSATRPGCGRDLFMTRIGVPAPVLVGLAGHQQPLRREQAALRGHQPAAVPGPAAHRLPAHARRQPVGVARQRGAGTPHQGRPGRRSSRRGGRVVVIDPRRTETARAYEHVAVRPDADAWLLLSHAARHLRRRPAGLGRDRPRRPPAPAGAARPRALPSRRSTPPTRTGVARRRASARWPATSPPHRPPSPTGAPAPAWARHGTLVCFLLDALTLVTGNLDRARRNADVAQAVIPLEDLGERSGSFDLRHQTARASVIFPTSSAPSRPR